MARGPEIVVRGLGRTSKRGARGLELGAKRAPSQAERADVYALYEASVQSPAADVDLISGVFARRRKRSPRTLREDFSGTAALSAAWVRSGRDRVATAVDIEPAVLAYAARVHQDALGTDGDRLVLRRADVLAPDRGRYDVVAAYNFSAFVFRTRPELLAYFRAARRVLSKDGMFFCDVFGGITAQQPSLEPRAHAGCTYIWEQASFDPLSSRLEAYIHFGFPDGSQIRRAFHYDWRLWQPVELRELLEEAGFAKVDVYWEDRDEDGEKTGRFRRRTKVDPEPSWTAYLVAER